MKKTILVLIVVLLGMISFVCASQQTMWDNLRACYYFDNSSDYGAYSWDCKNTYNATYVNGFTKNQTGFVNESILIQNGDYMDIGASGSTFFGTNETWSVVGWLNVTNFDVADGASYSGGRVFSGYKNGGTTSTVFAFGADDISVYGDDNPCMYVYLRNSGDTVNYSIPLCPGTPNTNEWYHVVFTYNGSHYTTYCNGTQTVQGASTFYGFGSVSSNVDLFTYNNNANPIYGLDGKVDELYFFNYTLTQSDIDILYNNHQPYQLVEYTAPTVDNTPPSYSSFTNNGTNSPTDSIVNFSITIADETALSGYIFAHNQSGTLTNSTFTSSSGTSADISELLTITNFPKGYICGQFWINDSSNNINQTDLSCFTVASKNNYPSDFDVSIGTFDGRNLTSLWEDDEDWFNVSEVVGTPGFNMTFDIDTFDSFDHIILGYWYDGSVAHNVDMQIKNTSGSWVDVGTITSNAGITEVEFNIIDHTKYNNSGVVNLNIIHTSPGNVNHDLYIDYIYLTTLGDNNAPVVNLLNPGDGSSTSNGNVNFNCSATDDNSFNLTLYHNASGTFQSNFTFAGSPLGTTLILPNGTYVWNCLGIDNATNSAFATSNFTFSVVPAGAVAPGVYNINLTPTNWFNNDVFNTSTTPGALMYFFMFIMFMCLVIITEWTKIPAIGVMTSFFGFFYGILIYTSVSAVLSVIFIAISLMYMIRSIDLAR